MCSCSGVRVIVAVEYRQHARIDVTVNGEQFGADVAANDRGVVQVKFGRKIDVSDVRVDVRGDGSAKLYIIREIEYLP